MAICAVIWGAEGWEDIDAYGQAQAEWFHQVLDVPQGIPCHDPLRRVLSRVHPDALTQWFSSWTEARRDVSQGDIVAIDGKTLRHAFDQAASTGAIHLVRAWTTRNRLVLGPLKVAAKSNEITAIPQLLKLLDLEGAIVTIDALGCQKDSAQAITEQAADEVVALQENHTTLDDDVTLFVADARATDCAGIDHERDETVDGDHGRIEPRTSWITADLEWLEAQGAWAKWRSIGMVESRRAVENPVTIDTRVLITSLPCDRVVFAQAVRPPWSLEHSLHGVLDVSCEEDACRIRQDQGAPNFAVLRQIALNLLRRESHHKRGIKARRTRAGWDTGSLSQILVG